MGKRGPAKTPTKQLQARDSWRAKARIAAGEIRPPAEKPPEPAWLGKEASTEWRHIVPKLHALGMLAQIDRAALARYCTLLALFRRASQIVSAKGEMRPRFQLVGDELVKTGEEERPEVPRLERLNAQLCKLESKFGLSPADRAGLVATTAQGVAAAGGADRFFRGRK